jgi:hypothetical protein
MAIPEEQKPYKIIYQRFSRVSRNYMGTRGFEPRKTARNHPGRDLSA